MWEKLPVLASSGFWNNLRGEAERVGYVRAVQRSLYSVANKHLQIRLIEVICLTREHLEEAPQNPDMAISSRLATESDLLEMREVENWNISDELLEDYQNGNSCLLSSVEGRLAGYTWIHSGGRPRILPGLRIRIPDGYLYNYAGYTAPQFRGRKLQSYRHNAVLSLPQWQSKKGMFGYVECTNWSSKKGQSKSGYTKVGKVSLVGRGNHFVAHFSSELKSLGIRRLYV